MDGCFSLPLQPKHPTPLVGASRSRPLVIISQSIKYLICSLWLEIVCLLQVVILSLSGNSCNKVKEVFFHRRFYQSSDPCLHRAAAQSHNFSALMARRCPLQSHHQYHHSKGFLHRFQTVCCWTDQGWFFGSSTSPSNKPLPQDLNCIAVVWPNQVTSSQIQLRTTPFHSTSSQACSSRYNYLGPSPPIQQDPGLTKTLLTWEIAHGFMHVGMTHPPL